MDPDPHQSEKLKQDRDPDPQRESKFMSLWRLKIEPWRAVEIHMEA